MKNAAATPKPVYLADYAPPPYRIRHVDLHFDLDPETTRVTARMSVERQVTAAAPLELHGEHITLVSLAIDGADLAAADYDVAARSLVIHRPPAAFELTIVTDCHPAQNTALEGLYTSSGNFCTQCEAEGFRRITYFLDRPDNMSTYAVTLVADRQAYPVLLSNGNRVEAGESDAGRHWVRWEDPFPKPSYLFALVAGDLACREDQFTTASGRSVTLRIYTEPHNIDRTSHAMDALKKAMRWDEERFGLEYDLDLFQIVSVDDFNMGAMENKGLNVFNSKLVLADPDTATDADFQAIEAVIAHEYFHNWTGNRVTCRDWFQLSLKEGLTVFRDQQFSADMHSAPVKRIEDVRFLRARQFLEDNGPMAHPVRPDHYIKIDNFYTLTVYEKGAEIIRMQHTLLGEAGFRRGMDLYFQRHDGQAVTCDDFVRAMEDANRVDLGQFRRWYDQAGTPHIEVEESYDPEAGRYSLTFRQHTPPTPGQPDKLPLLIPIRMGLLGSGGDPIPLRLAGSEAPSNEKVLELAEPKQTFVFEGVTERPVVSLLRGFSAPVILHRNIDDDELRFLLAQDRDAFNRWDASQMLATRRVLSFVEDLRNSRVPTLPEADAAAYRQVLTSVELDDALKAEALSLPGEAEIGEAMEVIDPDLVHAARESLVHQLAEALEGELAASYQARPEAEAYQIDAQAIGRRRLKNVCLAYLGSLNQDLYVGWAVDQVQTAHNMTDVMAGLRVLSHLDRPERETEFERFYTKWKGNPLVMDKWLSLQAMSSRPGTLDEVRRLMKHPVFNPANPNRVRALVGAFAMNNFSAFHQADGRGYRLLADFVIDLDSRNPQIASRLIQAMIRWSRFEPGRQQLIRQELQRVIDSDRCSDNTYEIVSRALE